MFPVRTIFTLSALAMALALSACSRPEADSSKIKILMPQESNSGQSGDELIHVVINVTGEGLPGPMLQTWDRHESDGVAPSSFVLDVPMGSNRLFQVLAVYEDSTSGSMKLYYGDKVETLSLADQNVTIPISSFSTSALSGDIAGRYLDTPTSGPTGVVNVQLFPGNNKPPMLIEQTLIANGWFKVFMLSSPTLFQYKIESGPSAGRVLFGGPVSLDDARFKPAANEAKALRVSIPAHQRDEGWSGTPDWQADDAGVVIYGWFADSANASVLAGRSVCRPTAMTPLTRLAKFNNTSNFLTGSLDAALPSTESLLKTDATSLSQYFVNGGIDSATGPCIGANTLYNHFLSFTPNMIDGNGKDGAMPFDGPFRKNGMNTFTINMSGVRVVQAQLLPGLGGMFDHFRVFKKSTPSGSHSDDESCLAALDPKNGYTDAGSAAPDAAGNLSITTNINDAEAASGVSALVCPSISGKMLPIGVMIHSDHFMSSGPAPMAADGYRISLPWFNVGKNQCHLASVELTTGGSGGYSVHTDPVNVSMAATGMGSFTVEYYAASDTTCSSGQVSTVTVPAGSDRAEFRYFVAGSGSATAPKLTGTSDVFSGMYQEASFSVQPAGSGFELKTSYPAMNNLGSYCSFVDVYRADSSGYSAPAPGTEAVTISSSPAGEVGIYSDSNCSTPISGFNFNSTEFVKRIYMKRLTGSAEVLVTFADASLSDPSMDFYISPVSFASHLKVELESTLAPGAFFASSDCVPLKFQLYDDMNAPIAGAIPGVLSFTANSSGGGQFYSTLANCQMNSGGTPNQIISIGTTFGYSGPHWYRNSSGGSVNVSMPGHFRLSNPASNVAFAISIPLNNPLQPALPYAWFDLNPYYNQSAGNTVSNWYDRVNGHQFTDASTGSLPQLGNPGIHGPWKGLEFSGTASVGDGLFMGTSLAGDITLVMRVKLSSTGQAHGLLQFYGTACDGSSSSASCALRVEADGSLSFMGYTDNDKILDTNWHTIAITRLSGGSEYGIYLDGTQVMTQTDAVTAHTETYGTVKIGYTTQDADATKTWFNGIVGDVIIYNSNNISEIPNLHNYLSNKYP